ncbi:MAG: LamG domain-containing protein [Sedimentisphaerales bacterium]|jgi:hypothetical protein
MCAKLTCLLSFISVLGMAGSVSADPVAHLAFDEGSGTVAHDTSGNGYDGTLYGDPQWTAGHIGDALEFDGDGDYVEIPRVVQDDFTLLAWIKTDTPGINEGNQGYQGSGLIWSDVAGVANDFILAVLGTKLSFFCGNPDTSVNSDKDVVTGEWVHVAATRSAQQQEIGIYIDGQHEKTIAHANTGSLNALDTMAIGGNVLDSRYYTGLIDDVQMYDSVLSQAEILSVMAGEPWPYAFGPDPADGVLYANTWVTLSWMPGQLAVSHDVYLGDNLGDVNSATHESDTFRGNQISTYYVAGFPGFAYPDGLVPGTTYYWRIDEVDDANPDSPWKGPVWSFSIPPKTAYDPDPPDGAESVALDAKLSWTAGFGTKLHTVYFGDDFDTVNNAAGGAMQGTTTYAPAGLEAEKVYYWRVDEFDAVTTYKGDVWMFTTPGAVGNPQPGYRATDVGMNAILSWTPADSAASHELYFGADEEAVRNADTGSLEYKGSKALGAESYDLGLLDPDMTYYWRVDEVDDQGNTAKGPLWIFTTGTFLLVDDFESYTDDDVAGQAIWQTWIDGFGIADNGAQVGYLVPPYCEQTIIHGGSQSMPLLYVNETGVTNSEASMTLTTRDWTQADVAELSLWFRGASGNDAEPLYVAVSNSTGVPAVMAYDDSSAITVLSWMQWRIPLQSFADQGINLSDVDNISVGLGTESGVAVSGGSGTIYVDDIRLYQP